MRRHPGQACHARVWKSISRCETCWPHGNVSATLISVQSYMSICHAGKSTLTIRHASWQEIVRVGVWGYDEGFRLNQFCCEGERAHCFSQLVLGVDTTSQVSCTGQTCHGWLELVSSTYQTNCARRKQTCKSYELAGVENEEGRMSDGAVMQVRNGLKKMKVLNLDCEVD